MRVIELDATEWRDVNDYNEALKDVLGSCEGHGNSVDAWIDSMLYGGMNRVEPPYLIRVFGTSKCPPELRRQIDFAGRSNPQRT